MHCSYLLDLWWNIYSNTALHIAEICYMMLTKVSMINLISTEDNVNESVNDQSVEYTCCSIWLLRKCISFFQLYNAGHSGTVLKATMIEMAETIKWLMGHQTIPECFTKYSWKLWCEMENLIILSHTYFVFIVIILLRVIFLLGNWSLLVVFFRLFGIPHLCEQGNLPKLSELVFCLFFNVLNIY